MTTTTEGQKWEAIYDILVECCGASEAARASFVAYMASEISNHEFRFCGWLGFGGKLYSNSQGVYVDCYSEQKSPLAQFSIKVATERISAALAAREEPLGTMLSEREAQKQIIGKVSQREPEEDLYREVLEEKDLALKIRCPYCNMAPGQACASRHSGWEVEPHKARIKLALDQEMKGSP